MELQAAIFFTVKDVKKKSCLIRCCWFSVNTIVQFIVIFSKGKSKNLILLEFSTSKIKLNLGDNVFKYAPTLVQLPTIVVEKLHSVVHISMMINYFILKFVLARKD